LILVFKFFERVTFQEEHFHSSVQKCFMHPCTTIPVLHFTKQNAK